MKKVYVTGSSGLVGSRFIEMYNGQYNFVTTDFPNIDITDKQDVRGLLLREKPDAIVHFAAYTDVNEAEKQRNDKKGDCWKINVIGTYNLISCLAGLKTKFVYISTDMVFGGTGDDPGPYDESHPLEENLDNLTWYGYSKAEAERVVGKYLGSKAAILRLIYPVRARYDLKLDYLRKPLALFDQGKLYPLFDNQQISISFIDEISLAVAKIIDEDLEGIFHAGSPDTTTPYELTSYLIEKARGLRGVVKPTPLSDPLRYPMFGGLRVDKTQKKLGIQFRSWKKIVDEVVRQLATF